MKLRGKFLCWLAVMAMMMCVVVSFGCGGGGSSGGSDLSSEDINVPENPNESDMPYVPETPNVPDTPYTPEIPDVPDSADNEPSTPTTPNTPSTPENPGGEYTLSGNFNGIWQVDSGELTYTKSTATYNSRGEITSQQVMDSCTADYVEAVSITLGIEVTNFEIFTEQGSTSGNYMLTISHDEEVRGRRATDYGFIAKMRRRDNGELIGQASERTGGMACIVAMGPIECSVTANDTISKETGTKDTIGYTAYRYRLLDVSTIEYAVDMITPEQVLSIGSTGSSVIGEASMKLIFKRVN